MTQIKHFRRNLEVKFARTYLGETRRKKTGPIEVITFREHQQFVLRNRGKLKKKAKNPEEGLHGG